MDHKIRRSLAGRKPKFSDPDDLLDLIMSYLNWVKDNPLYEEKLFSNGRRVMVPKKRYPSTQACARHCGVSPRTWRRWRKTGHPLSEVVEWADTVIWCIKIEGAAVGLFSPAIVARELWGCGRSQEDDSSNLVINIVPHYSELQNQ